MHMKIFQPDLVILIQFLHAAMRNMLYINLQENAKNHGVEFYQCVRRFMRLPAATECHRHSQSQSRESSQDPYCPYYHTSPRIWHDSYHRSSGGLWHRDFSCTSAQCKTRHDVKKCIMDLARSMETSCKTIIHHYTNFIMMTPIALNAPTKDKGVFKDGLIDFMTENALPNMFDTSKRCSPRSKEHFQIRSHPTTEQAQPSMSESDRV